MMVRWLGTAGAAVALTVGVMGSAQASQKVCVYDLLGASGDLFNMSKDYAVEIGRAHV